MPTPSPYRKPPRTPPGCEDHLTRQQAAQLLGYSSEFKIRQLEREGRLKSVRGAMRTAFYARADVLALKAQLGRDGVHETANDWNDAELLLLLRSPNREGRQRTALDLVLETRISIDRAQNVFAFWASSHAEAAAMAPAVTTTAPEPDIEPGRAAAKTAPAGAPVSDVVAVPTTFEPAKPAAVTGSATRERPPMNVGRPESQAPTAPASPAQRPHRSGEVVETERRGEDRLSRDSLIAQLRDPDPRLRDQAFALLRELQAGQ